MMKKANVSMTRIFWYENNSVEFLHTILLYKIVHEHGEYGLK